MKKIYKIKEIVFTPTDLNNKQTICNMQVPRYLLFYKGDAFNIVDCASVGPRTLAMEMAECDVVGDIKNMTKPELR